MPDNQEKKEKPATSKMLDALCQALGMYTLDSDGKANYNYDWFFAPVVKSKTSLATTAQKPILDALQAILTVDGEKKSPWKFRLHKDLPIWIRVTEAPSKGPLIFDVVGQIPKPPAAPTSGQTPAEQSLPYMTAEARLVKLVVGGQTVAELQDPIELGLRVHLAKPASPLPDNGTNLPLFAGLGVGFSKGPGVKVSLELIDAAHLSSSGPLTMTKTLEAATRKVVWEEGDSWVLPLVHSGLLVLRGWLVQLCKKHTATEDHFSWRIYEHLLPLLEGTKNAQGTPVLPAFPIQVFKDGDKLRPWLMAFLTPGAVMTVLYHLRALFTGKAERETAPGSAIAWFADPNNDRTNYSAPLDNDFGIVVHSKGDINDGHASLGMRGQACWYFDNRQTRLGFATEGELIQASWKVGTHPLTNLPNQLSCKASTGKVATFVVLERVDQTQVLANVSGIGELKRVEIGVWWSLGQMEPCVRVTTSAGAVESFKQGVQAVTDILNALSAVPAAVKSAMAGINPASVLDAIVQWAKAELANVTINLGGFATLNFGTNDNSVTIAVADNAFNGPIGFSGTSFSVNGSNVSLTVGISPRQDLGLSRAISFGGGLVAGAPSLWVKYGPTTFSLLNPTVLAQDIVSTFVRPLLDNVAQQVLDIQIVQSLTVRKLIELLGIKPTGWSPPAVEDVLKEIIALGNLAADDGANPPMFTLLADREFADGDLALKIGKIKFGIFGTNGIAPSLDLQDIELKSSDSLGKPIVANDYFSLGKLGLGVGADLQALKYVAMKVHDIRLPLGKAGNGNAGLMSTGKENPGLGVEVRYDLSTQPNLQAKFINGSPNGNELRLSIDRVIGPIDVRRLRAVIAGQDRATTFSLLLDAEFKMGGVRIAPQGLGVSIPIDRLGEPDKWSPTLEGLGLSFQQSGISISGMLAKTNTGFAGQAALSAFGFQLGAIAAYDKIAPDGVASLVVFAVLDAMLGGPPFFVVTGVAGGFGVNRAFERPARTADLFKNPLLATMQGQAMDLDTFRTSLAPKAGAYWLAGGVRFVSYGFIHGNALIYVLFDGGFEIGLIALARMEIPKLARIQLAVEAGMSLRQEPTLYAKAELYDSWLLHEDCKLTGGFALQVWPEKGDAVITLGGYHPRFAKPSHYPTVDRIGFSWSLGSAISIKGGCYFAMTPREAMGGGHLEVEGTWGPLAAGFRAAVDGLIGWDPFYFDLSIEVGVWIAISTWIGRLRMSLGVRLHVYGPPVGGIATIDISVITIDIPFGQAGGPRKEPLPVAKTLRDHLQAALPPNVNESAGQVQWPALNLLDPDAKSPLRATVAWGQVGKTQAQTSTTTAPLRLAGEFKLRIESVVPLLTVDIGTSTPTEIIIPNKCGPLYLTLAHQSIQRSVLKVDRSNSAMQGAVEFQFHERPMALFGPLESAGSDKADLTREVTVEVIWNMMATLPTALEPAQLTVETSTTQEQCPLPLARSESTTLAEASALITLDGAWTQPNLAIVAPALAAERLSSQRPMPRRNNRLSRIAPVQAANFYRHMSKPRTRTAVEHAIEAAPQVIELAYMQLPTTPTSLAGKTNVAIERANLMRTSPVHTPIPRSPLLAGVELHVVTPRGGTNAIPAPLGPAVGLFTRQGSAPRSIKAPAGPVRRKPLIIDRTAFNGWQDNLDLASLPTGEACVLDLAQPGALRTVSWRLVTAGAQRIRAIAIDAGHQVLDDFDVPSGNLTTNLPEGTRRLALLGLGIDANAQFLEMPVWENPSIFEGELPQPPPRPPMGFGIGTSLLGIAARTFVAPGCVLVVREGELPISTPLGLTTGAHLMQSARRVDVRFRPLSGLIVVQVQAIHTAAQLDQVVCEVNGEIAQVHGARVRGNALAMAFVVSSAHAQVSVRLPEFVRLLGVSRWPGRMDLPENIFDVPIHHIVRPQADTTSFRVEVMI